MVGEVAVEHEEVIIRSSRSGTDTENNRIRTRRVSTTSLSAFDQATQRKKEMKTRWDRKAQIGVTARVSSPCLRLPCVCRIPRNDRSHQGHLCCTGKAFERCAQHHRMKANTRSPWAFPRVSSSTGRRKTHQQQIFAGGAAGRLHVSTRFADRQTILRSEKSLLSKV